MNRKRYNHDKNTMIAIIIIAAFSFFLVINFNLVSQKDPAMAMAINMVLVPVLLYMINIIITNFMNKQKINLIDLKIYNYDKLKDLNPDYVWIRSNTLIQKHMMAIEITNVSDKTIFALQINNNQWDSKLTDTYKIEYPLLPKATVFFVLDSISDDGISIKQYLEDSVSFYSYEKIIKSKDNSHYTFTVITQPPKIKKEQTIEIKRIPFCDY